ncbi:MAG: hypothetical protein ACOC9B_03270 [Chloroflexota bacterium]
MLTHSRYGLPALNTFGLVLVLTLNGLANALPINGVTTGKVSDQYDNLFTPAGFTFSIWGLIYLLLIAFVVYEWLMARSGRDRFSERIGFWFLVSCLANASWILAWHYGLLPLSLVLMLVLLGSLLTVYLRLGIGLTGTTRGEWAFVHLPFSVYLGWITVATIANVAVLLVSVQWDGFGLSPQFWTAAVIAVATGIALAMAFRRRDIYFCLVVDWALLGILLKRLGDSTVPDQAVVIAAIAGMALVSAAIAVQLVRKRAYGPATGG